MDEEVKQAVTAEPKSKLKIKQRRLNKLIKHYKILDTLIFAANINDDALLVARDKVEAGRDGNKAFRAMASQLGKEQLIKLRSDLKIINLA
jgi:hypothetical protein